MDKSCVVGGRCLVASVCLHTGRLQSPISCRQRRIARGEQLWDDEGRDGLLTVILDGLAAINSYLANGNERILRIIGKGETYGLESLFKSQNRQNIFCACTDMVVCQYPKDELMRYVGQDKEITTRIISDLSQANSEIEEHIVLLSISSARERVKRSLEVLARREIGTKKEKPVILLTHDELSAFTGLNRVTVTRVLKELEEGGDVICGYGRITIRDRGG